MKQVASPANCTRLNLRTPCVETGLCSDCASPDRICNQWSIIEGHCITNRIHLLLVGQSLGY